MADPVLDIATLITRPQIKVDDELHEILSPDELSVVDYQRFAAWGRRIDKLMAADTITTAQQKQLTQILTDLTDRIMVGVPEEIRAKLKDSHRFAVAEVFTRLPLMRGLQALTAGATQTRPTGARRRRGSKGSTAGRPAGGSPKPRSRSSGRT